MKQRVINMLDEVSQVIENIPELTHLGNPVLRQITEKVSIDEGIKIAHQLIEILTKYKELTGVGAGLAAPQIGLSKKVFVTAGQTDYEAYINPEILTFSPQKNYYRESCLSSRMLWGDVERPEEIEIIWTDVKGQNKQEKFTGFKARLLQHEYDHLLGIMCLDKALPGTVEYSGDVKEENLRDNKISI